MPRNLPLAVTSGDPAGIGAEIAVKCWQHRAGLPTFFLIDDPERIAALAPEVPVAEIEYPEEVEHVFGDALPVLLHEFPETPIAGKPQTANAEATVRSIERAVQFATEGMAAGVVTNPINKKVLYDGAAFRWPGHTEFLAHLGGVERTVMMLVAPGLRVVPVTIHIALSEVPLQLTKDAIVETCRIVDASMKRDFGIGSPRLAVAGLNPHAGEGGAMGHEDIGVVAPAVQLLRDEGIDAVGPLPADTMFHAEARARYDVAITMYHDQGLIPIKTLDFAQGVNVTLGLPFVRTSPDHGTAYDIAGTGRADHRSLMQAIRVAGDMARMRAS